MTKYELVYKCSFCGELIRKPHELNGEIEDHESFVKICWFNSKQTNEIMHTCFVDNQKSFSIANLITVVLKKK